MNGPAPPDILDAIRDAVVITDERGFVLRANSVTQAMFGLAEVPPAPTSVESFFNGHTPLFAPSGGARAASNHARSSLLRGRATLLDGSSVPVSGYATEIQSDPTLYVVVIRVLSERLPEASHTHREIRLAEEIAVHHRTAEELHDGVLQSLTVLGMKLAVAGRLMEPDPGGAAAVIAAATEIVEAEQKELRLYVDELKFQHPLGADVPGQLEARLRYLMERAAVIWEVDVELCLHRTVDGLAPDEERAVLRLVQEAVVNAARHGRATRVTVWLEDASEGIRISVADDGKGFPFVGSYDHESLLAGRLGPLSLKRRVGELGGRLRIRSSEAGATVAMDLPIPFAEELR